MAEVPGRAEARKTRKIVAVVAAAVVGFALLSFGAYGLFIGFERPLEAGDLDLVVTVDRVSERVEGLVKRPGNEKASRTRYIDGSYEVDYEYEDDDVSITSTAFKESTLDDARQLFMTIRFTSPNLAKLAVDGVEFVPRTDLYSGGDDCYSAAIVAKGVSAGHLLLVRNGKRVFLLSMGGVFLDGPGELRALVQPRIDALNLAP